MMADLLFDVWESMKAEGLNMPELLAALKKRAELVDITGVNKCKLLKKLWDNQTANPAFMNQQYTRIWDEELAERLLEGEHYVAYFMGRAIKCNLAGDKVNPTGYDQQAGKGEFQRIVDEHFSFVNQ